MDVGLVERYGRLVIDERLIMHDMLFAVSRTEGLWKAIEVCWIATKDGRIVRPGCMMLRALDWRSSARPANEPDSRANLSSRAAGNAGAIEFVIIKNCG